MIDPTNDIDPTARIADGVTMGKYNRIGAGVVIEGFKGGACKVTLGDCNTIQDGTRIICPDLTMGDWCVVHNHCTLGGPGQFIMGHNAWFGQEVWLDSTGGLTLGNGVRIGLRSHVWSHVASGEELEGWLYLLQPTTLEDDVWCVGDDVHVASGVRMGARSAAMAHSVVTRDTKPDTVYAGAPAREVSFRLRHDVTLEQKFGLMASWAAQFVAETGDVLHITPHEIEIFRKPDAVIVTLNRKAPDDTASYFSLVTKRYTKRLTVLERDFYRFLFGHRARFLPE